MTDEDFIQFVRECTLSNEEIASHILDSPLRIRKWRGGTDLPDVGFRKFIVRDLSMLEHTRLSEQIQTYLSKRTDG